MVIIGLLANGDKIIGESDEDFESIYGVLKIAHEDVEDSKQFQVSFTPVLAPYSWDTVKMDPGDVICVALAMPAIEEIYRRVINKNEKDETTEKVIHLVKT
jgi:hypothetical protein